MRIVQTSYPRVKKIYTYDITQEELDELKFTWEEFQDALVEDSFLSRLLSSPQQACLPEPDQEEGEAPAPGDRGVGRGATIVTPSR